MLLRGFNNSKMRTRAAIAHGRLSRLKLRYDCHSFVDPGALAVGAGKHSRNSSTRPIIQKADSGVRSSKILRKNVRRKEGQRGCAEKTGRRKQGCRNQGKQGRGSQGGNPCRDPTGRCAEEAGMGEGRESAYPRPTRIIGTTFLEKRKSDSAWLKAPPFRDAVPRNPSERRVSPQSAS